MPVDSLAGTTVLQVAASLRGAYCGKLLRENGATVIGVDPPHGDRPAWERRWLDAGAECVALDW
jgi:crotonobetainyl-CoA:carnitine CoA-transferase CaiB-like acyl-CoA transferase